VTGIDRFSLKSSEWAQALRPYVWLNYMTASALRSTFSPIAPSGTGGFSRSIFGKTDQPSPKPAPTILATHRQLTMPHQNPKSIFRMKISSHECIFRYSILQMLRNPLTLLCLAYIIGLGLIEFGIPLIWLSLIIIPFSLLLEWASRRFLPGQFPIKIWLMTGAIALVAITHYTLRSPQPNPQDISQYIDVLRSQTITVKGTVEELPRLTRNQQMQIWLKVQGLDVGPVANRLSRSPDLANGRLYVTAAVAQGADVHPGQRITVTGQIYRPQPAKNPGGFDFAKFLQRQNCFTGLRAEALQIVPKQSTNWGLWMIQRRIVRSQAAQLPHPEGALISAMVLGGKVVDLPFALKDQFAKIGLSHALAASGFQVTLILGVILSLTQRLDRKFQITIAGGSLLLFLGLTGLQPSVCRAVVMGAAVLWAMAMERKLDPIGALLFAVTFLLLLNPLWIGDLGFQLSVLATLGLIVTVPWLTTWFAWLPNFLTSAITVPLAALLWTLPLQLQAFGVVSPYCLIANVITTPLVALISLVGMVNAVIAVISPTLGSWTAMILHWPTWGLIRIVELFAQLPGSAIAIGTIPVLMAGILYGLILLLWGQPDLQRYGWAFGAAGAAVVWFPTWQWQAQLTQITALSTNDQPVLVVQAQNKTGLINSGQEQTAGMTVLPFLQQQGVNRLDWAVAFHTQGAWQPITDRLPINQMYHFATAPIATSQGLATDRSIAVGKTRFERLSADPDSLSLRLDRQHWLILGKASGRKQTDLLTKANPQPHQVLYWTGSKLQRELVRQLQPQVAIAYGQRLDAETEEFLQQQGAQVYWLSRDGAVQWQPSIGFRPIDGAREALL
jgi:competence protein ComEC